MPIQVEFSEEMQDAINNSIKSIYFEAMEEAKRDAGLNKEFLTIHEVMERYSLSRNTLTNNFIERGLPIYKINNKQYIKRSEMNQFIEQHQI